jgi:amidase
MITDAAVPNMSTYDAWQLNLEKYKVADAWFDAWNATAKTTSTGQPIDGLLMPISPNPAHLHRQWSQ